MQEVAHGCFQRREAGRNLIEDVQAASVALNSPPQQTEIELHGDEAVADLVRDMRSHLPEVSEAVFAGELTILDVELVGQTANLGRKGLVSVLKAIGGFVPGRENRLEIKLVGRRSACRGRCWKLEDGWSVHV